MRTLDQYDTTLLSSANALARSYERSATDYAALADRQALRVKELKARLKAPGSYVSPSDLAWARKQRTHYRRKAYTDRKQAIRWRAEAAKYAERGEVS